MEKNKKEIKNKENIEGKKLGGKKFKKTFFFRIRDFKREVYEENCPASNFLPFLPLPFI
jgi:hypothetical protein